MNDNLIDNLPLSSKDDLIYNEWISKNGYMGGNWYSDVYLKTDHWQIIKKEKLESVNWCCQLCNKKISYHRYSVWPNTHHRSYYCLWKETFEDVILLCRECHAIHHNKIILKDLQYPEAIGRLVAQKIAKKSINKATKELFMGCLVGSQENENDVKKGLHWRELCENIVCIFISGLIVPDKSTRKTLL